MTDNELLLAISNIVQSQIDPLKKEINDTHLLIENVVIPRLQEIENCYTTTSRRYANGVNDIDRLKTDVDIIKKVVSEHSEKLQKIS